jgi:protein-disulfide isomerase
MKVRRTGAAAAAGAVLLALALTGCGGSGGHSGSSGSGFPGFHHATGTPSGNSAEAAAPKGTGAPKGAQATTPPAAGDTAPADGPAGRLPSRLEANGTTITVGDPAARHTLTIDEDPRCSVCKRFEDVNGTQLAALAQAGKVKLQYTMASFLDDNFGGDGSKRTVNALRAAVPSNHFAALHALVYANQPKDEMTDGFTAAFLLDLASRVDGLRTPAFDAAVRGQTYAGFVDRSESAFLASGAAGTPTVKIDGTVVSDGGEQIFDAKAFKALLKRHGIS